jgi:GH24 family phage-related lysozyme (muramidase)
MNIISILKEEQKQYRMSLLEDIQDSTGAAMVPVPGSSLAARTLFPTSYPRDAKKIKLKQIPTTSMEEFLMKLQELQAQMAQQMQQQNEGVNLNTIARNFGHVVLGGALSLPVTAAYHASKEIPKFVPNNPVTLTQRAIKQNAEINAQRETQTPQSPSTINKLKASEKKEDKPVDVVKDMLTPHLRTKEGYEPRKYLDSKGKPTIGYGTLIDGSFDGTLQQVFPHQSKEWRQKVASGQTEITRDQAEALLSHHAKGKFDLAKKKIGEEVFDSLPNDLQMHLASETYRGMLPLSAKTIAHIKRGDLQAASKEYIDADEYTKNTKNSIGKRMKELSDVLAKYHGKVKIPQPVDHSTEQKETTKK